MSPIGLFWLMPLLVSAFGLLWSTCIMKNSRLAFVSGILLIYLAFGGGILSWFALINGGPNLMAFSSLVAVLFGAFSAIHAGIDDLNARSTIGEQDGTSNGG